MIRDWNQTLRNKKKGQICAYAFFFPPFLPLEILLFFLFHTKFDVRNLKLLKLGSEYVCVIREREYPTAMAEAWKS